MSFCVHLGSFLSLDVPETQPEDLGDIDAQERLPQCAYCHPDFQEGFSEAHLHAHASVLVLFRELCNMKLSSREAAQTILHVLTRTFDGEVNPNLFPFVNVPKAEFEELYGKFLPVSLNVSAERVKRRRMMTARKTTDSSLAYRNPFQRPRQEGVKVAWNSESRTATKVAWDEEDL